MVSFSLAVYKNLSKVCELTYKHVFDGFDVPVKD